MESALTGLAAVQKDSNFNSCAFFCPLTGDNITKAFELQRMYEPKGPLVRGPGLGQWEDGILVFSDVLSVASSLKTVLSGPDLALF